MPSDINTDDTSSSFFSSQLNSDSQLPSHDISSSMSKLLEVDNGTDYLSVNLNSIESDDIRKLIPWKSKLVKRLSDTSPPSYVDHPKITSKEVKANYSSALEYRNESFSLDNIFSISDNLNTSFLSNNDSGSKVSSFIISSNATTGLTSILNNGDGYITNATSGNGYLDWNYQFNDTDYWFNVSSNFTSSTMFNQTSEEGNGVILTVVTAVILAFMILATVVGNVFVIAAILLEKNLQSVANYLILSLAVADLLVAALVMPLGAVYEVSKEWTLGPELCDMWTVSDVLCCTASILHLVAIALDRYWAVTNVNYIQKRSPRRVGAMIGIIWSVSTLISCAPLMGWKDHEWHGRINSNKVCLVSQDVYYQIFATMTSFYLPLGVILILYWRIYQAARKRIRRKITQSALCGGAIAISETTTFTRISSNNESPEKSSNNGTLAEDERNEEALRFRMAALPLNPLALLGPRQPRKREMEARRERKAAKTLAIITGVFVICWMPFFVMALLMPICSSCSFSPYLVATLLWLGYFNSTLNPIIYTIFSPDFRHAFRRIICGKKRFRKRQFNSRSRNCSEKNARS